MHFSCKFFNIIHEWLVVISLCLKSTYPTIPVRELRKEQSSQYFYTLYTGTQIVPPHITSTDREFARTLCASLIKATLQSDSSGRDRFTLLIESTAPNTVFRCVKSKVTSNFSNDSFALVHFNKLFDCPLSRHYKGNGIGVETWLQARLHRTSLHIMLILSESSSKDPIVRSWVKLAFLKKQVFEIEKISCNVIKTYLSKSVSFRAFYNFTFFRKHEQRNIVRINHPFFQ